MKKLSFIGLLTFGVAFIFLIVIADISMNSNTPIPDHLLGMIIAIMSFGLWLITKGEAERKNWIGALFYFIFFLLFATLASIGLWFGY
ncbi:MAG: hypothetical protein JW740_02580 [Candidatus Zambryskibacteria bacterium]|nr:hypothetical protein [Candidatus Zambryskibacteria bacterium]